MSLSKMATLFESIDLQDYGQFIEQITELSDLIHEYDGETESIWYLGELGEFTLMDLLVGAYWHFNDYHAGQDSASYATLCAIGQVYDPGMTLLVPYSPEQYVYDTLQALVEG